jgi:hypothetical protein
MQDRVYALGVWLEDTRVHSVRTDSRKTIIGQSDLSYALKQNLLTLRYAFVIECACACMHLRFVCAGCMPYLRATTFAIERTHLSLGRAFSDRFLSQAKRIHARICTTRTHARSANARMCALSSAQYSRRIALVHQDQTMLRPASPAPRERYRTALVSA